MQRPLNLFGLARAVASGQQKLADLRPHTQRRVQDIIATYGADGLGGHTAPTPKIGARVAQPRKVQSR